MSIPYWSLFFGVLLITMVLAGTLLARLPLSSAMIYLGVGYALGPGGLSVITPDPTHYAHLLERVAEAAVIPCLLAVRGWCAIVKMIAWPIRRWRPHEKRIATA